MIAVVVLLVALGAALAAVVRHRARRGIATATQRATYEVLHTAAQAAEPLRAGLTAVAAGKAVGHLRRLIGATGLAIIGGAEVLAFEGAGEHHADQITGAAAKARRSRRAVVLGADDLGCDLVDCPVRGAVVVPLVSKALPVADAHTVYFVSLDNMLRAVHRGSGNQDWKKALAVRPTAGPIRAADAIIVTSPSKTKDYSQSSRPAWDPRVGGCPASRRISAAPQAATSPAPSRSRCRRC